MELRERDKVLIDIETTGFDKEKNQVLEVGMLILRNDEVIDEINVAIKHPEYTLTTGAMKANRIDLFKHEEEAVTCSEAVNIIINFLSKNKMQDAGFVVLGQNVQFDIGFLEKLFYAENRGKEFTDLISHRTIDIMQLAFIRNIEGKIKLKKLALDSIMKALCVQMPEDRHRALADCHLELRIYKKLLNI